LTRIIAAIDNSLAARPVLAEARLIASVLGAGVAALHVREGTMHTSTALAAAMEIPLITPTGPAADAICREMADPAVLLGVLGSGGGLADQHGAVVGHTALDVLARVSKPVIVVPPQARIPGPTDALRIALPVEGDAGGSGSTDAFIAAVSAHDDVVVIPLHVLVPSEVPPFWDQPHHAVVAWSHEFGARHCPQERDLRVLQGVPGPQIVRFVGEEHVDLVVLDWGGDLGPGHAWIIRDILGSAEVPVLLAPRSPVEAASPAEAR
jgi:nucleotide-binding universal stress UspA family protein